MQITIEGKIITRETVDSFWNDVTQKNYVRDVKCKNKLLDKQKKDKKKNETI